MEKVIQFLSKVKVKNFTMSKKWVQTLDNLNQTVRGTRVEKVPNRYPNSPLTIIGEAIVTEGFWMPKPGGMPEFIVTESHQTFIVAWGMRNRFKATLEDVEPYEEAAEEPAPLDGEATTQELAQEPEEKGPLGIWCFTWPDGLKDWVAAESFQQATEIFKSVKIIGEKDLEEIKVTRQDLRGTNTVAGSVGAGKRWGRVMFEIDCPMYIGGKE